MVAGNNSVVLPLRPTSPPAEAASTAHQSGPVAQLGARLNGIQEVTGSIPVRSTNSKSLIPNDRDF